MVKIIKTLSTYFIVLSQMLFTFAVTWAFFSADKQMDFLLLISGYILLAFSFSMLILLVVLKKMKR